MASHNPRRLVGRQFEKIWGSTQLEPWFSNTDHKVGEVWFAEDDSPVLMKFLFTTENLSVQVHPDDTQARLDGGTRGKTEMWHILRAEPNACIALGLNEPLAPDELRQASLDGSIMEMLRWIPVQPGDTWFVPAGAIHAIGAGIALCEIQQYSDLTYRLFDYGRARDLHLAQGMAVANTAFRAQKISAAQTNGAEQTLVDCPYFRVEFIPLSGNRSLNPLAGKINMLIATHGQGSVAGQPFQMGQVWMVPATCPIEITGEAQLLRLTA